MRLKFEFEGRKVAESEARVNIDSKSPKVIVKAKINKINIISHPTHLKKANTKTYALQTVFPSSSFLQSGVAVVWQL